MRIFTCLLVLVSFAALAQPPGGGRGERPKIGIYKGTVQGGDNQKALPYSKIFLLSMKDSAVVTGGLTGEDGTFSIEEIPVGAYIAKITSYGYKTLFIDSLFFFPKNPMRDAGVIFLEKNDEMLGEVEVIHRTEEFETEIDKKVFNVDKQLTSQGGTALDALQNVPSVSIDMDGNVSLRGSANVTILIDGRPSSITGGGRQGALESIPASSIESIEIITNPSAKYDPDGMSGIINIVLKKNKLKGFNGNIDLSIENGIHPDSLDKYPDMLGINYNLSGNLSYRNKFFNAYIGASTNHYEGYRNYTSNLKTWYNDVYDSLGQVRKGTHLRESYMIKAGSDFYLNAKNTIGFSINTNIGNDNRTGNMFYYNANLYGLYDVWQRISLDPSSRNGMDANLFYTKTFDKKDQKLEFNGRYSLGSSASDGYYTQNNYNPDLSNFYIVDTATLDQYVRSGDGNNFLTLQLDYYQPIKSGKIETGAKTTVRNVAQEYYQETFDIPDDSLNNKFDYNEQVYAAYGIFGKDYEKFKFQVGLRLEQVFVTGKVDKDPNTYVNNYFSYYPSVHLVKPLTDASEVTLSYSRRVDRPSLRSLNPFARYSDPYNLQRGNPKLNPEYINSIELGYGSYGKKITLTASVYYRLMTNMIQRVKDVDSNGVSTTTWQNLDQGQFIGLELVSIIRPAKWWRITASGNFSQTYLNSSSGESDLNNSGISWTARLMQSFTFEKGWSAQITSFYMSPMILAQGFSKPMYGMDVALKKSFFDDKMYLNFKVTDVFFTRRFAFDTYQEGVFESSGMYRHQSRRAMITFGYRFGNQDPNKRKRGEGERENMGGGGGEEF